MSESDILLEAERVVSTARSASVDVRLIGGVAVARHCRSAVSHPGLVRTYRDIDLVARPKSRRAVADMLSELGYVGDERFNNLHGHARLLFYDVERERQLDVFLGVFRMCHTLELGDRFFAGYDSVPLADLALTKLQIVEMNEKDTRDLAALFLDHELAEGEAADMIDLARLRTICCGDWGFYTTVRDNLDRIGSSCAEYLPPDDHRVVAARFDQVTAALEEGSKSLKWRLRSRVGRRAAWYEIPEEVRDAPA
jgi:hypothetical protein